MKLFATPVTLWINVSINVICIYNVVAEDNYFVMMLCMCYVLLTPVLHYLTMYYSHSPYKL